MIKPKKYRTQVDCPNCKGKGHVLNGGAVFCMTVFSLVLVPFERNDSQGITRKTCDTCDGTGYVTRTVTEY